MEPFISFVLRSIEKAKDKEDIGTKSYLMHNRRIGRKVKIENGDGDTPMAGSQK